MQTMMTTCKRREQRDQINQRERKRHFQNHRRLSVCHLWQSNLCHQLLSHSRCQEKQLLLWRIQWLQQLHQQHRHNLVITSSCDSYDVLWSCYDCHKLIYKVMIINKNSNRSQPLKTVVCIMNNGSTDLKKFNNIKHLTVCLNKTRVINGITPAMKTFRAEWWYRPSIRYRVLYRATNWKPVKQAV